MNMVKKVVTGILITAAIVIGIVLIVIGVNRTVFYYSYPDETSGLLVERTLVKGGKSAYDLTYRYVTENDIYYLVDRTELDHVPQPYHTQESVRYDRQDPEHAILTKNLPNQDDTFWMMFFGILLILVPITLVLLVLSAAGRLGIIKEKAGGILLGILPIAAAFGLIWLLNDHFDLIALVQKIGPFILIPTIALFVGVRQIIRTLLPKRRVTEEGGVSGL